MSEAWGKVYNNRNIFFLKMLLPHQQALINLIQKWIWKADTKEMLGIFYLIISIFLFMYPWVKSEKKFISKSERILSTTKIINNSKW